MKWIIQGNLDLNEGIVEMIRLLSEKGIEFSEVKSVPFSDIIVDIDIDINDYNEKNIPRFNFKNGNVVTFGSYSLALAAKKFGWFPGAFINENYEYDKWLSGWGKENILNGEAIQGKVADIVSLIPEDWDIIFSRPTEDTKSFAGQVFRVSDFKLWMSKVKDNNDISLCKDTSIIISKVKEINKEYRLFIVDGKYITGSLYKIKDKVITSNIVPEDIINYALDMLKIWTPDRAFVLDIADTNEGNKIIEINNINSSGFYKADISKIIDAINGMNY